MYFISVLQKDKILGDNRVFCERRVPVERTGDSLIGSKVGLNALVSFLSVNSPVQST